MYIGTDPAKNLKHFILTKLVQRYSSHLKVRTEPLNILYSLNIGTKFALHMLPHCLILTFFNTFVLKLHFWNLSKAKSWSSFQILSHVV